MTLTDASHVFFGISFQIASAICIFINDLKEIDFIIIESNKEDIEVSYTYGYNELIQCKSIQKQKIPKQDDRMLVEALIHLNKKRSTTKPEKYAYCSNQNSNYIKGSLMLSSDELEFRHFKKLSPVAKKRVQQILTSRSIGLQSKKLRFIKLPFYDSYNLFNQQCVSLNQTEDWLSSYKIDRSFAFNLTARWNITFSAQASSSSITKRINKEEFVFSTILTLMESNAILVKSKQGQSKYRHMVSRSILNYKQTMAIIGMYKKDLASGICSSVDQFICVESSFLLMTIFGVAMTYDVVQKEVVQALAKHIIALDQLILNLKEGACLK